MKTDRRISRELALKALYQNEFQEIPLDVTEFLENFLESKNCSKEQKQFAGELLKGLKKNQNFIDDHIKSYSINWPIQKMPLVDLNIIRIAVYEMLYRPDIPSKASLNEALELSKSFGSENSVEFVNGILDKVLKNTDV